MPVVFLFSAMVSGIAAVLLLYMVTTWCARQPIDMRCVDTIARYLLYAFVIDFSPRDARPDPPHLRGRRVVPRARFHGAHAPIYSQVIVQILWARCSRSPYLRSAGAPVDRAARKRIYAVAASLTLIGIFAMRWNVVIGGQLFSKSFLGYTTYKMGFATREGLLPAIALMVLPFVLLWALVKILPPWPEAQAAETSPPVAATTGD